jgi:REP element-mobilizing transposase RayT
MPVRTRLNITGPGLFFVTTTAVGLTPVFTRPDLADAVLRQFAETSHEFQAAIVAYTLMPSHLHTLVGLENASGLKDYMKTFKSLSARAIKEMDITRFRNRLRMEGRFALWRRGFDDLLIYSSKQFKTKVEYIHNNPVKKELVASPTEYPYSSARDWAGMGRGVVPIDTSGRWIPTG